MRRKRPLIAVLLAVLFCATITSVPAGAKKRKTPCAVDLAHCPDEGCGTDFDPNLNRLKNITPNDPRARGATTPRTLTFMKKLDDAEEFEKGGPRDELTALGEGERIMVVGYLLRVKPEGGESCNCGLTKTEETDNHLVLVTKATVNKFPLDEEDATNQEIFRERERESITAEFTPRVRQIHPNFTRAKVQPLVDDTEEDALLVRITGMLLFDSEHFLHNPLVRVNNWEIHPILKFEICRPDRPEKERRCTLKSDAGWKNLDEM
jgi:hypothetical protein